MSTIHDQSCVLLQVVSLSPAFSAGQVSLGTLNRQLTCVCFVIQDSHGLTILPWRWQQQILAKQLLPFSKPCPCLHVCLSTLLPRYCYITLLFFLANRRQPKTWARPKSRGSMLYSGKRLYPLLKASRMALGPTQHLMQWTHWVPSPCVKRQCRG